MLPPSVVRRTHSSRQRLETPPHGPDQAAVLVECGCDVPQRPPFGQQLPRPRARATAAASAGSAASRPSAPSDDPRGTPPVRSPRAFFTASATRVQAPMSVRSHQAGAGLAGFSALSTGPPIRHFNCRGPFPAYLPLLAFFRRS